MTKIHWDPQVNALRTNVARMQGALVAGGVVARPIASTGCLSPATTAATSLVPSASISNQPEGLKQQGKWPWKLNWYECPHSVAIISLSISVFRQTMLQNHPFDTKNLDGISLASYQSAVNSLKDSSDKG